MPVKTKQDAKDFRVDLDKALEDIAKKWGLKDLQTGSIQYNADFKGGVKVKVEGFGEGRSDAKFAKAESEWKIYVPYRASGICSHWLGETFKTDRGQVLTIRGWCNRKRKDKIVLTDGGGREYKAPVEYITQYKSQLS